MTVFSTAFAFAAHLACMAFDAALATRRGPCWTLLRSSSSVVPLSMAWPSASPTVTPAFTLVVLVRLYCRLRAISDLFHSSCAFTDSTACCFALLLLGNKTDHFLEVPVCLRVTQKVCQYFRVANPPDQVVLNDLTAVIKGVVAVLLRAP